MSDANVLPTAPEYTDTVQPLYRINEIKEINAEDFRLKKISDFKTELTNEAEHYRQIAKNINDRTPLSTPQQLALVHFLLLSSATLATALTSFGIVASPALAGVATGVGLTSVGLTVVSKRLERKVTKHEKIYTLAHTTLFLSWFQKL